MHAGRRLLMLLNYTILKSNAHICIFKLRRYIQKIYIHSSIYFWINTSSEEDVALSCRLFHWPKDLDSVLQVSAGKLYRIKSLCCVGLKQRLHWISIAARLQRIRIETERLLKERTAFFLKR